jgi:hypothetical protein
MIPRQTPIHTTNLIGLTKASSEEASTFRIPRGVDAPTEIFVAIIPRDHQEFGEAIVGEPVQTSACLMSAH